MSVEIFSTVFIYPLWNDNIQTNGRGQRWERKLSTKDNVESSYIWCRNSEFKPFENYAFNFTFSLSLSPPHSPSIHTSSALCRSAGPVSRLRLFLGRPKCCWSGLLLVYARAASEHGLHVLALCRRSGCWRERCRRSGCWRKLVFFAVYGRGRLSMVWQESKHLKTTCRFVLNLGRRLFVWTMFTLILKLNIQKYLSI